MTLTYTLALAMELADKSLQDEISERRANNRQFEEAELWQIYKQTIETLSEIFDNYKILHR